MKDSKAEKKAVAKARRQRRNAAFKRNVERFGLPKAKMIAALVTKKRTGGWFVTLHDINKSLEFNKKNTIKPVDETDTEDV